MNRDTEMEYELQVLYEDNHCLAVHKPPGLLVAADRTGDKNLLDLAKSYIKQKYDKPGAAFLGLVHRLDRPVSGIVLFARTSKSAARLSEQFRNHTVDKTYLVIVEPAPKEQQGILEDYLVKNEETNTSRVVPKGTPGSRYSRLRYRVLSRHRNRALLEIELETGRSHQIRLQLSSHGCAVLGDKRYGGAGSLKPRLALHAWKLSFDHPTQKERIHLESPLPRDWSKLGFLTKP